jgi:hypothetical protein
MAISTDSITTRIADALGFLTEHGFRYFKSYQHFRRKDASGFSYVTINVTTSNRASYSLAFYVGTRVDPLETAIRQLRGDTNKLDHYSRSVSNYTVNVGPRSCNWDHPVWGNWSLQSDGDIDSAIPEASTFIRDTMLPFANDNTTAENVRKTLLDAPGKTINLMPHHQILAADVLNSDLQRLDADYAFLDQRHEKWIERLRLDLEQFYTLSRAAMTQSSA